MNLKLIASTIALFFLSTLPANGENFVVVISDEDATIQIDTDSIQSNGSGQRNYIAKITGFDGTSFHISEVHCYNLRRKQIAIWDFLNKKWTPVPNSYWKPVYKGSNGYEILRFICKQ